MLTPKEIERERGREGGRGEGEKGREHKICHYMYVTKINLISKIIIIIIVVVVVVFKKALPGRRGAHQP